jgi:hypothetical protein
MLTGRGRFLIIAGTVVSIAVVWLSVSRTPQSPARALMSDSKDVPVVPDSENRRNDAIEFDSRSSTSTDIATLPAYLQECVMKARGSEPATPWADIIIEAWTDLARAMQTIELVYRGDQKEQRKQELIAMLSCCDLNKLGEGLPFFKSADDIQLTVGAVAHYWSKVDPVTLAQYAESKLSGKQQNRCLQCAVESLVENGRLTEANLHLSKMALSTERSDTLRYLATKFGGTNLEDGLEWASRLDLADEKVFAAKVVISAAANSMETTELIASASQTQDSEAKKWLNFAIGEKLVSSGDFDEARTWIQSLPESFQNPLMAKLAIKLAQNDLAAGTQYALQMRSSASKETVFSTIAQEALRKDPATATSWEHASSRNSAGGCVCNCWHLV